MKILIVDDSLAARIMIKGFIKLHGEYDIIEATNGKEGVQSYKDIKPDLTFLDLTMPVMDGFEALKQIMKFDYNAKVVVLTADIQSKTIEKINKLGAEIFIKKPPTKDLIINALDKLLENT